MIKREIYLRKLRMLKDKHLIKVVTGIRRSGKSCLLKSFQKELKQQGISEDCIVVRNFEERELDELKWTEIYDEIMTHAKSDKKCYVFLDEVQMIEEFERLVNALFVKENIDLYVTGSNAYLLSSELATFLSGRYIDIHIHPFSFAEYAELYPDERHLSRLFQKYCNSSSFPEAVTLSLDNPEAELDYLKSIYNTVVVKDISKRHSLRKDEILQSVLTYMYDSVGSLTAPGNIAKALSNDGYSISHNTITKYLGYFSESYLLYPASRYDLKGKKILTTNQKYYAVDLGLRNVLQSNRSDVDLGHKIENIVYLELMRRNIGRIYVGQNNDKEVDFLVQKTNGTREYYQVSYSITDEKTRKRELDALRSVRDSYPKYLLTMDYADDIVDGIFVKNIVDWLLDYK